MIDRDTLVRAIAADDRTAFDKLYEYYKPRLLTYAHQTRGLPPNLAEDLIHDIFLWVWNNRVTWSPQGNLGVYFTTAMKRRMIDRYDRAQTAESHAVRHQANPENRYATGSTDDALMASECDKVIQSAFGTLRHTLETIAILYFVEDQSIQTIAEKMKRTVSTIRANLRTIRQTVRDFLTRVWW